MTMPQGNDEHAARERIERGLLADFADPPQAAREVAHSAALAIFLRDQEIVGLHRQLMEFRRAERDRLQAGHDGNPNDIDPNDVPVPWDITPRFAADPLRLRRDDEPWVDWATELLAHTLAELELSPTAWAAHFGKSHPGPTYTGVLEAQRRRLIREITQARNA